MKTKFSLSQAILFTVIFLGNVVSAQQTKYSFSGNMIDNSSNGMDLSAFAPFDAFTFVSDRIGVPNNAKAFISSGYALTSVNFTGPIGNVSRTVTAWIKTSGKPAGQQGIISWGGSSNGTRFAFDVMTTGFLRAEFQGTGLTGTKDVCDGTWHYVALVFEQAPTNKVSLLVDGVLDVSFSPTQTINTAASPLYVGTDLNQLTGRSFVGIIDELNIYSTALTVQEILDLRNTTVFVSNVTLDPNTATLTSASSTQQLTANILPASATNKTINWESDNTNSATVSPTGLVTAVATGTANITATTQDGSKIASAIITVDLTTAVTSNKITTTNKLFPNPATTIVNCDISVSKTIVYNNTGQALLKTAGNQFNVKNLPSGSYIVRLFVDNGFQEQILIRK